MKSRDEKSKRREEKRREKKRKRRGREEKRREEKRREGEEERGSKETVRRKKVQVREKVGKSRNTCVFPMSCGSRGSKSRLAKAADSEPSGQMRDEKFHAVVARSTFPSQNAQSTPMSDHSWKSRCRKSAHRCGGKQISKSKCLKKHHVRTTFRS